MNIKHSQLEFARKNPRLFKSQLQSGDFAYFGGKSRYRLLQLAIFHYHKSGNDRNEGLRYLRENNRTYGFANGAKLAALEQQFGIYVDDFDGLNTTTVESGKRVKFEIGPDVFLTGEVPRLDLRLPRGYLVCFLQKIRTPWLTELRFPVIQQLFANAWGCSVADVVIGVYSFTPPGYIVHRYSAEDINQAQQEVTSLVNALISP